MNGITLALISSWMDATLRRKDWHPPTTKLQIAEIVRKYYIHISPSTRFWCLESQGLENQQ